MGNERSDVVVHFLEPRGRPSPSRTTCAAISMTLMQRTPSWNNICASEQSVEHRPLKAALSAPPPPVDELCDNSSVDEMHIVTPSSTRQVAVVRRQYYSEHRRRRFAREIFDEE